MRALRSNDQVMSDKQQDRTRKDISRKARTVTQVATAQQQNKTHKQTVRALRSNDQVMSDKQQDRTRKDISRKARTVTQVATAQQQNKTRKQTVRALRSNDQVTSDKQQDRTRKDISRKARTVTQVATAQQQNKTHKQTVRALRSNDLVMSDKQQDKTRKQVARTSQKQALTVQSVLANYKAAIREGPTYSCSCCCRMLYRRSVLHCIKDRYTHFSLPELNTVLPPENYSTWICQTCHSSLKRGKLPAQATANQLHLEEIPESLAMCCSFETQLISKVICFQKIFKKPRGAQHGIKGQAVLVPADLSKVSTSLPRATPDGQFIALALKRRLSDRHDVCKQFIRPAVVNDALAYLRQNNKYYADVAVNSEWEETSAHHDQQLWSALTGQPLANQGTISDAVSSIEIENATAIRNAQEHDSTSSHSSPDPVSHTNTSNDLSHKQQTTVNEDSATLSYQSTAATTTENATAIPNAQEHDSTLSHSSPDPGTHTINTSNGLAHNQQSIDNEDSTTLSYQSTAAATICAPVNPSPDLDNEQEITDSEDEVELGNPSQVLDDLLNSRLVNSKTCIYPVLGPEPSQEYSPFGNASSTPQKANQSVPTNKTIQIAPGEGKTPVSRTKEPGWEAMAHPVLHPTGTTTYYTPTKRKTKLSSKRYVNARLLHKDGRFAESTEFCFSALDWIETEEISSSISITARKRFQEDITVGDLRNPDRIGKLLTEDQVFATFKKMRGTPQSWKQMSLDMHAKLRQLGPYTFFITGNSYIF